MAADGGTGLRRGLAALAVLADADGAGRGGLGVLDVARRLGVDKSQASRTLRALAEAGLAERDPATRAFRLGPRVFAYAAVVAERRVLRSAPAVLERLVTALGERAHLSVLDGPSVLTLLTQSPPLAVQAAGWPGRTVPAYCTAAGRALLADHDEARLTALLGAGRAGTARAEHAGERRRGRRSHRGRRGPRLSRRRTRSSSPGCARWRRPCAASTATSWPP